MPQKTLPTFLSPTRATSVGPAQAQVPQTPHQAQAHNVAPPLHRLKSSQSVSETDGDQTIDESPPRRLGDCFNAAMTFDEI